MSNQQDPVVKVESSPSPVSLRRGPSLDPAANSLPPTRTSVAQPYVSTYANARPTDEPNGLTVTVPRLTPQEVSDYYLPWPSDGNNYSDRQNRRAAIPQVPNAPPPYNYALRQIDYTNYEPPKANRQYAGVPAAHNMIPTQPHSQETEARQSAEDTHAYRAPRKTRYQDKGQGQRARINNMVLPDMALPENSNLTLNFTSLNEARHAVLDREIYWMSPSPDDTLPTNDEQRAGYVRRLLLAMRNRDEVLDKDAESKRYHAKGQDDMGDGYYYKAEDMEKVCWEVVSIAEKLHIHGPKILNTYDRETLKNIKKDIHFTFEERMQYLIKILCFFKSKCDTFMKGSSLEEIVAQPLQKLIQAITNRGHNDRRAKTIAFGRKVELAGAGRRSPEVIDSDSDTNAGAGAEEAVVASRNRSVSEQHRTRDVNTDVPMQSQDEEEVDRSKNNTSMDVVDKSRIKSEPL